MAEFRIPDTGLHILILGCMSSGKSTLLNALAGSDVLVEDKLFATLDTTTKQYELPGGAKVLLTDTVGFIRNLPHRLVEAFKSTLEYLAQRVHPEAELINKQVSKILDYADCRRAITGSGIIALEEYIDRLTLKKQPR